MDQQLRAWVFPLQNPGLGLSTHKGTINSL